MKISPLAVTFLLSLMFAFLCTSLAAQDAPTVNGRFFGNGDNERYSLTALSIGGSGLYTATVDDVLYVALVVDRSVNDNVFDNVGGQGNNPSAYQGSADWGRHRTFRVTIDSEYAEFTLEFGEQSWVWKQGYAGQPGTAAPGVDLLTANWISDHTVAGGAGTPPPTYQSMSSLAWNVNTYITAGGASGAGWDMGPVSGQNASTDWVSPKDPSNPNTVQFDGSGYPVTGQPTFVQKEGFIEWEWSMVYEWSVDLAELANQFNDGVIPDHVRAKPGSSHHSPSKNPALDDDIFVTASAVCPEGDNRNPVRLAAEIPELQEESTFAVDSVEFLYWQVGVSTSYTSALGYDNGTYTTNPVTVPVVIDGLDNYLLDWDTRAFDLAAGSEFQIQAVLQSSVGQFEPIVLQIDFDLEDCQTSSYPVTLASFSSRKHGGQITAEWWTASEIANLGFNLYGEDSNGDWHLLNADLLLSHAVDSFGPQFYSLSFDAADFHRLFLEDVDTEGQAEIHGPFAVGETAGRVPEIEPLDWASIRSQNNLSREAARSRAWRLQDYDPVRMLVDQDGIYRVTYEDLLDAGMDLRNVPVAHIGVTNQGNSVPIYTEARGRFGPGDFIEFYAEALNTLYTDANVYVLHVDNHVSARMREENLARVRGTPVVTYLETFSMARERSYHVTSRFDTPWFDTRMLVTSRPRQWNFDFDLEGMVPESASQMSVEFYGTTRWEDFLPDHHVEVYVNGTRQADHWFEGHHAQALSLNLAPGLLHEDGNTLTIRLPADTGVPGAVVNFVGFEVEYPRVLSARDGSLIFDSQDSLLRVSGLNTPQPVLYRVENDQVTRFRQIDIDGEGPYSATFAGTGQLATYVIGDPAAFPAPALEIGWSETDITSGQADYLMISHPAFMEGLQPLVAYHESLGRVVKVVSVHDVYDQFSHGIFDPLAIQSYIRATAESMGYEHVLLVGADTYDYKNNLGVNSVSFIPSIYGSTSDLIQFAPLDALFVDLNGNNVPDLPIGRLPVRTPADLDEIIHKTMEYAQRPYRETAILASDKQEPGAIFSSQLDQITTESLDGWFLERAYLDELSVPAAKERLMTGINEGASLTAFLGHSDFGIWTFSGLFSINDVSNLSNHGRPTVVAQFGCWNTYHVLPAFNTLGHRFLLTEDRGAAVAMGSATRTNVSSGLQFGHRLMPRLLTPGMTIGQAVTAAKQQMAHDRPYMQDMILGWTILGDPALVIVD